MGYNMKIMG